MGIKRRTKSVTTMLSIFESGEEALSVVNLVERLKNQMNKTTVYRILERLEKEGAIHSFSGTNGLKWYAKCSQCTAHHHNDIHPHFECKDCGKVECLEVNIPIPSIEDRNIQSVDVLLTGQCTNCMI
ncbi:Fur family transcriptional regulator [Winogradskyella flava]|uniref:Transcriptional repressor n=1 Tax=Winogradskyella flava TaxID=1884876 RepID=A0A842IV82_9FLAO|nr:transcriptional repressor [Winogradskyella flava]MBC2846715.1 transcriptional repressor [Winogradskyella flava]